MAGLKINRPTSLKETMNGFGAMESFHLIYVPLDKIIVNEKNEDFRKLTSDEQVEAYATNIKLIGMSQPLEVLNADEEGRYKLVAGETRYRALLLLKEQGVNVFPAGVPAKISQAKTDLDEELLLYSTNILQRHYSDDDFLLLTGKYIELLKKKAAEKGGKMKGSDIDRHISQMSGLAERKIRRYRYINEKLIDALKEAYRKGEITQRDADEYIYLDELQQELVVKYLKEGRKLSVEEVKYIYGELIKSVITSTELKTANIEDTLPAGPVTTESPASKPKTTAAPVNEEDREEVRQKVAAALEERDSEIKSTVNDTELTKRRLQHELGKISKSVQKAIQDFLEKETEYKRISGEHSPGFSDMLTVINKDLLSDGGIR